MGHRHTAGSIVTLVDECTEEQGIPKEKKNLTIITDSGSSMVATFHCNGEEDTSSEEDNSQDSDEEYQGGQDERSVYTWCSSYIDIYVF